MRAWIVAVFRRVRTAFALFRDDHEDAVRETEEKVSMIAGSTEARFKKAVVFGLRFFMLRAIVW
jgi:hypothetical protein